jgi:hypothetical protein
MANSEKKDRHTTVTMALMPATISHAEKMAPTLNFMAPNLNYMAPDYKKWHQI